MRFALTIMCCCMLLGSCILMDKKEDKAGDKNNATKKTMQKVDWLHNTNIYEVNVRQYTPEGTFAAFAKHIPRLKEMGVEVLWFMPITPIAQKNKKGTMGSPYACSDYTAINPEFGTLDDFKAMVKTAHDNGLKVIIDWVANHTGWDHVWTKQHPDYYLKDSTTNDFQIASGMDDIIELNYSNPALRKAMIEAMQYWVKETGIDGYRCDLASWVEVDFWEEARPQVDSIKTLFWLGEFDELETPAYGKVFDASYSWKWMHSTRDYADNKISLDSLVNLLQRYSAIGDSSMRAWFTTNHDENSWNGTEYEKYGDLAIPLAVFSATWNGVPLLYTGQELPNHKRLEFFEKDPIAWTDKNQLHDFYKTLLTLHHNNPALRGGDNTVQTFLLNSTAKDKVLVYKRKKDNHEVLVLLNLSKDGVHFAVNDEAVTGTYRNVFSNENKSFTKDQAFELPKGSYLVFEK